MKIEALRLFNVKRFAGRGVAIEGIGDGVNVLCAANEFGKSTSFEALHALFFQPHSSTSGDVRALRPYSGGNPLVEADIATGSGSFRITKQFYGGRSARVVDRATQRIIAQADEAENFIAGLVRGGTAGPAGLLWVRQGVTGIEKRSRSEEDSDKQLRAGLLESVQGEVEAVTGGRRMAEIAAATEEALGRLVTPTGRPKAGERYAAAIDDRDRLEAEEKRLAAEVATLRDALDRRASAARRLAELDRADDRAERRKAVEAAEAGFDAARIRAEALRAAEAEMRLARDRRDGADRELKAFRAAVERSQALRDRLSNAAQLRADAIARRDEIVATVAGARLAADAAEVEEHEARALLARLEAALRARDAAEQLASLEQRLEAAAQVRADIEAGEAVLALLAIPDDAVAELGDLDIEIARLRAVAEAGRATVTIAYVPEAQAVSLDGTPLPEGEQRGYDGQAQLSVPGVGLVTLRSNRPAGSDERLRQAQRRREELLASTGVADLASARSRQLEAQRKQGDLRELRTRLALLAPEGLPKLREEIAARSNATGADLELKEDPVRVRAAHADAEARRVEARRLLRETESMQAGTADAVVAAETALAGLTAECAQTEALLGPQDSRLQREREAAGRLEELQAGLAREEANVGRLQTGAVDLASADAALRRARSVVDAAEKEIGRLREEIAALNAEIRARSDDAIEEKWRETADALTAARRRAASFEKEVAVLQRLRAALDAARSHARDTYLKPVMNELRPLLALLFADIAITFDEKTLLPQTILRNGQEEEVERLSGGMREQLSVLTRLAFARLMAKDGRPAPVILDDALVYSDDDRIERMFDALHRQARDQQIIVFSCRQRAFQKLGGHVLQMTDWQPE